MSRVKTLIRLSLTLLLIESSSCIWNPLRDKESLCKTTECQARGEEYKNNMNTSTDPCQDFYTFTCGNWRNNHPGPKYAEEWNAIDVMNLDFSRIIRKTLESYNFQQGDNILLYKAKEVYETCAKIPEYPRKDANDIAREIIRIGRVPNTPLWNIHLEYLKLSGESAFFRTKVLANIPSDSIPMILLMEPRSAYGSIYHTKSWKPQEKQAYIDYLFLIMKRLRLTGSDALIKERIEKVFEFRKMLDQIIERNSKKNPDKFNPLNVSQLDLWFLNALHDQKNKTYISWTKIIEILLQHLTPVMRQTQQVVAMRQKQYFLDLMDLFKNVSEEVLAQHMEIYFVERHLKLQENMFKLLEETSVKPHARVRYIRQKYKERWQMCIEDHNMSASLEKLLYYKWFPKDNVNIILGFIGKLKIAIEKQMMNSKWLDQPTREKTMRKLSQLEQWIGFPPWIIGVGTSREHMRSNKIEIMTPNALLNIEHNLLYVHAPLMVPPVFDSTMPDVYNYAGIGTSLGHEFYHVMDDCGSYLKGDENIDWWPPSMRALCLRRMKSFVKTFNKITDREFKDRYYVKVKSDTTSSLSENFPDVMGLKAAYNAYKELPSKEKSVCQTLPHFEKYSCDQMFYIAFANTYCGYYTKESAMDKLETSDHSIDSVRINGAIAQMENFGTVFGCSVGSPMNPQEKLDLWK